MPENVKTYYDLRADELIYKLQPKSTELKEKNEELEEDEDLGEDDGYEDEGEDEEDEDKE
jgi:hypothetical protein